MRGAAFLSGVQDAIVIDIGGTTTDVGVLKGGFPRQAATRVKVNVFHCFLTGKYIIPANSHALGVSLTPAG